MSDRSKRILFELDSGSLNILYHTVKYNTAIEILSRNFIRPSNENVSQDFGIVTNREENYLGSELEVTFALDEDQVTKLYKLEHYHDGEVLLVGTRPTVELHKLLFGIKVYEGLGIKNTINLALGYYRQHRIPLMVFNNEIKRV